MGNTASISPIGNEIVRAEAGEQPKPARSSRGDDHRRTSTAADQVRGNVPVASPSAESRCSKAGVKVPVAIAAAATTITASGRPAAAAGGCGGGIAGAGAGSGGGGGAGTAATASSTSTAAAAPTQERINNILEKALAQKGSSPSSMAGGELYMIQGNNKGDTNQRRLNHDSCHEHGRILRGKDASDGSQQRLTGNTTPVDVANNLKKSPKREGGNGGGGHKHGDNGGGGSEEETQSRSASSSATSSESYTSSSYSESEGDDSDDGNASNDTFYVPEDKKGESFDEDEGGGIIVHVTNDGDNDKLDQGPNDTPSAATSGKNAAMVATATAAATVEGEEDDTPGKKAGRAKRKRPAHRHYIKDDTMRTLFGLIPFYGGGDGPMDQMVKATLASVGSNTIDVRDQEGNTLLILACQHACEDLVEPILVKGADPLAVNGVGVCPLHYTCYSDSLSLEAAESLLWRGADPSAAETTYGCTPLHYAASAGDPDLCALLVEHGAQPQAQDYYTYTAVKYASDAGYEAIVELLGGNAGGEEWPDAVYVEGDDGDDGNAGPSGGLWLRHMDPETGLAYHMNDETGESWWETDLMAVAKDFLAAVSPTGGTISTPAAVPPLGAREWLVQEQVRSWLVAVLCRTDPMRLMEVDLLMERGKADFKAMLKDLLMQYSVKEVDFLRNSSAPTLECLGVLSLIPSENDLGLTRDGKGSSPSPAGQSSVVESPDAQNSAFPDGEGFQKLRTQKQEEVGRRDGTGGGDEGTATNASATVSVGGIGSGGGGTSGGSGGSGLDGQRGQSGRDSGNNTSTTALNRVVSTGQGLKGVDSPAILRADGDRKLQEVVSQQEKELEEERRRQKEVLDEQRRVIRDLETMNERRQIAVTKAKEEADAASSKVSELQSELDNGNAGKDASDRLSVEISQLRAGVAAERVRFTHITEALEATKGSLEERAAKQQAQEEDRCARLELLKSENAQEVESICVGAAETLSKAEETWEIEKNELEQGLSEQVEQVRTALKDTIEGAAKVLSEATTATETAIEAAKQGTTKSDEARTWMRANAEEHSHSKQVDQTNKQLHTSLRREMERAKQVCLRDGKQTLALLTVAQHHWSYTHVFQNVSMESTAKAAAQAELHKELAGLGISLADGHSVLLLAAGAATSGKTLTLVGDPEEARASGSFFLTEAEGEGAAGAAAAATTAGATGHSGGDAVGKRGPRKAKTKGGGAEGAGVKTASEGGGGVAAKAMPLAGLFPRLVAETFATLLHRRAQCAFTVTVNAAAVSMSSASTGVGGNWSAAPNGDVVECLLPSPPGNSDADDGGRGVGGGDGASAEVEAERNPARPPPSPAEISLWGSAVPAASPQEVVAIVEAARLRATTTPPTNSGTCTDRHFLSRIRVELENHSTKEMSSCEMVLVELAEENPGDSWPVALGETLRAHATATAVTADERDGVGSKNNSLIGMVRGCLRNTAKVVTFLCVSPADNQADKTERALHFGKACQDSGEGGASQLKDLKKELVRLKKEGKGAKKPAPSQLPRPTGGKRH